MTTSNETRQLGAAGVVELSFRSRIDNPTHKSCPPISQAAIPPPAPRRVRLQYLARRLHALGERPLFHLRQHLERYAALPADFIRINNGDRFAPALLGIDGGRR